MPHLIFFILVYCVRKYLYRVDYTIAGNQIRRMFRNLVCEMLLCRKWFFLELLGSEELNVLFILPTPDRLLMIGKFFDYTSLLYLTVKGTNNFFK